MIIEIFWLFTGQGRHNVPKNPLSFNIIWYFYSCSKMRYQVDGFTLGLDSNHIKNLWGWSSILIKPFSKGLLVNFLFLLFLMSYLKRHSEKEIHSVYVWVFSTLFMMWLLCLEIYDLRFSNKVHFHSFFAEK